MFSYAQEIAEPSGSAFGDVQTNKETVGDIYSYSREVMIVESLLEDSVVLPIGDPNCIVEIDEAKFGKRKYNHDESCAFVLNYTHNHITLYSTGYSKTSGHVYRWTLESLFRGNT